MLFERCLHDSTMYAAAPAVNEPNLTDPGGDGRIDVLGDDRLDVRGRERVEIQFRLDGNANRLFERHGAR